MAKMLEGFLDIFAGSLVLPQMVVRQGPAGERPGELFPKLFSFLGVDQEMEPTDEGVQDESFAVVEEPLFHGGKHAAAQAVDSFVGADPGQKRSVLAIVGPTQQATQRLTQPLQIFLDRKHCQLVFAQTLEGSLAQPKTALRVGREKGSLDVETQGAVSQVQAHLGVAGAVEQTGQAVDQFQHVGTGNPESRQLFATDRLVGGGEQQKKIEISVRYPLVKTVEQPFVDKLGGGQVVLSLQQFAA